jgi:transcriptional regulator with XRE-family HTH domain
MTNKPSKMRIIFAKNLREIRTEQNLSQEDLAMISGLHRTYIGSIERGERNISIDNMAILAQALNIHLCYLLKDPDEAS